MPSALAGASGSALATAGVRRPHHGDISSDTVEPDHAVHPPSLDCRLAFHLQAKFDEEAVAAASPLTTMPTLSIRWIVTRSSIGTGDPGLRGPSPAPPRLQPALVIG